MGADSLTAEQYARWTTVLYYLIAALPADDGLVIVDSADGSGDVLAGRLADRLRERDRTGVVVHTDAARAQDRDLPGAWHLTVWVRTPASADGNRGDTADATVDLHDRAWPVLRHIDPWLVPHAHWYRTESRAFFATRASTWDAKFRSCSPTRGACRWATGRWTRCSRPGWCNTCRIPRRGWPRWPGSPGRADGW